MVRLGERLQRKAGDKLDINCRFSLYLILIVCYSSERWDFPSEREIMKNVCPGGELWTRTIGLPWSAEFAPRFAFCIAGSPRIERGRAFMENLKFVKDRVDAAISKKKTRFMKKATCMQEKLRRSEYEVIRRKIR